MSFNLAGPIVIDLEEKESNSVKTVPPGKRREESSPEKIADSNPTTGKKIMKFSDYLKTIEHSKNK